MRRTVRGSAALIVLATMMASTAILNTADASASPRNPRVPTLSDGRWAGTLHWTGTQRGQLEATGLRFRDAPFSGSGSMQFVVQGDQIEESTYSMAISGTIDAVGGDETRYTGDRTMTYGGTVGGVPESPCLQGQYDISGTVTAHTPLGPLEVSLAPGDANFVVECSNMPLHLIQVSCDVATGTFAPYFTEENARYGLRLNQQATFVMFRAGDYFTPAEAETNAIQIQDWVNRLNSEVVSDPLVLRNLLSELDRFFGDVFRNDECGRLGNGATILADAVRVMTLGYLSRTSSIEIGVLHALIRANFRVGNFSFEGDTDPLARRVQRELYSTLDDYVDSAEGANDSDLLETIETIARQFGWNRIANRAREAWGRLHDG